MARFEKVDIIEKFIQYPIVPVMYDGNVEIVTSLIQCCYNSGIRVFEYTNRGTSALNVFKKAIQFVHQNCPDLILGIGTIFNSEQAETFISEGADFIVQPVTTKEVSAVAERNNISWIPGVATATEIYNALELGASMVKIFPANVLGPAFVKGIKGPMPDLKIMVTGGIEPNAKSIDTWFQAGVSSVGIGSQLFPEQLLKAREFDELSFQIKSLLESIKIPAKIQNA